MCNVCPLHDAEWITIDILKIFHVGGTKERSRSKVRLKVCQGNIIVAFNNQKEDDF